MENSILSTKYIACLTLLFLVFNNELLGQTKPIPTINEQQSHVLTSKINKTKYHLSISLPQHYATDDSTHYPVLYVLDGGLSFNVAHAARTSMDLLRSLEDVIIVGIEYDWLKSYEPWFTNRWTDFTPIRDSLIDESPNVRGILDLPTGALSSGGASIFLTIIKDEIIPFIDERYKTTTDMGISGHSLGGLFVSYCLLTEPELFTRYGINSPSLWWKRRVMFDIERAYSEEHDELKAKVFMSVGSLEGKSMTPVMIEFAEQLRSRKYSGLELTHYVFEDETHTSVVPAMMSRTIRVLYERDKSSD